MAERLTTISTSGGCRFDPCLGQAVSFFALFIGLQFVQLSVNEWMNEFVLLFVYSAVLILPFHHCERLVCWPTDKSI
ncbi:hypothetical protein J3E68DRAFT_85917 [Trichoderma sp. SZMC 28012]